MGLESSNWKQAVHDLSRSVIYKALGDIQERLLKGERINNKSSFLPTLIKLEAKKTQPSLGAERVVESSKGFNLYPHFSP